MIFDNCSIEVLALMKRNVDRFYSIYWDFLFLTILLYLYIVTEDHFFLISIVMYGGYAVFNQLIIRHQRQVFIEPKKLKFYKKGRNISIILILVFRGIMKLFALFLDLMD